MLILTRKPGEAIEIGGGIVVTVVSAAKNGQVRLGIKAPTETPVHRQEVAERIRSENGDRLLRRSMPARGD